MCVEQYLLTEFPVFLRIHDDLVDEFALLLDLHEQADRLERDDLHEQADKQEHDDRREQADKQERELH